MCKNDTVDPSVCATTFGFDFVKKTVVLEDGQTTVVSAHGGTRADGQAMISCTRVQHTHNNDLLSQHCLGAWFI